MPACATSLFFGKVTLFAFELSPLVGEVTLATVGLTLATLGLTSAIVEESLCVGLVSQLIDVTGRTLVDASAMIEAMTLRVIEVVATT